jgi:hypothetical protein
MAIRSTVSMLPPNYKKPPRHAEVCIHAEAHLSGSEKEHMMVELRGFHAFTLPERKDTCQDEPEVV